MSPPNASPPLSSSPAQRRAPFTLDATDADSSEPESDLSPLLTTAIKPTTGRRARGRSLRTNVLLRAAEVPGDSEDDDDDDDDEVESVVVDTPELYPVGRGRSASVVMVMAGGAGRREEVASPEDTVYWGWVVLVSTWIAVVTGVGSVTGVWEWAWGGGEGREEWTESIGTEGQFPIPGYYPAMCILTGIMAWVWVTVAWVGMKYFKHAKIQG